MAGIVSVSRTDLTQRRQRLRRRRQMKIIQAIWRTAASLGLAGSLLWVAIQPFWLLKAPKDIEITGNELLSDEAVQSMLVLSYPQSVWRIEPNTVAKSLRQKPSIAKATVSRRLFPPGLTVKVKERVPVAIVQSSSGSKKVTTGLLDISGVLIPLEKHTSLNPKVKLPTLKVIGSPEKFQAYWGQLYQAVSQSSVKVMEIDCQDSENLILTTELGQVHLGPYGPQLPEQIKVLAQMTLLSTQLNSNQVDYIDLKNPDSPLVQMNSKKTKQQFRSR